MRPDVLLEVAKLSELPLANLTAVGLDPEVDPSVLWQVRTVRKRLAALRAFVGLRFPHVRLCVQLELCLGTEHLERIAWLKGLTWIQPESYPEP